MKRPLMLLATLASLGTVVGDASAACATAHIVMFFDAFPGEAVSRPLYWTVEGNGGTTNVPFRVTLFGGDCSGNPVSASYRTDAVTPNAADYVPAQGEAFFENTGTHADFKDFVLPVTGDTAPEPALDLATLVLFDPKNGAGLARPSSASVVIVDDDAPPHVSVVPGDHPHLESQAGGGIPVFRGGTVGLTGTTVSYTVTPDPANPATPGEDYDAGNGVLTFDPGQRVQMIPITVLADAATDPDERLKVSISGPEVVGGSQEVTFTIIEAAGLLGPVSSLHHPRQKLRYRASDYRIREIHIFTRASGVDVIGARFALRRNMKKGSCAWLAGKRFKKGPCDEERWLITGKYEKDFFYYRMKRELKPSRRRIRNYTAFSRAQDAAGQIETSFVVGRNSNTFEVKPPKRRKR